MCVCVCVCVCTCVCKWVGGAHVCKCYYVKGIIHVCMYLVDSVMQNEILVETMLCSRLTSNVILECVIAQYYYPLPFPN